MHYRTRATGVLALLACGFTVISVKLVQIQLVQHEEYRKMAIKNHLRAEPILPLRGSIYDYDGELMAETQTRTDLRLDGKLVDAPAEQLPKLADLLQIPLADLTAKFDARKRDIPIAGNLDDTLVTKLRELNVKWKCLIFRPHEERFYPNNELASHVLGYVDGQSHGRAGIEKEMDDALTGVPGERWVEHDALSREIAGYQAPETPARPGFNVTLTIRSSIQHVVEGELDQIVQTYTPKAAYIIVMDPHTGEIMAMASRPCYDPNDSKTFTPDDLRNRCITDGVEPGSIFKIITLAGALNEGKMTLQTPIFCENGAFPYGGKVLHDDEPEGHGLLSAEEVLSVSSNIGFAKIALNYLGPDKLYKYATAFGIGSRTGVMTGQGESTGILQPVKKWSGISITRIPMGQEVLATPIQMISAMCVIANGGRLVVPRLVEKTTDDADRVMKVYQPAIVRQVISPDTASRVAEALEQVTIDGTAKKVKIEDASGARWSYAGKTGTAQIFVDGAYSHTKFVSSFLGFVPAKDPAFVTLIMVVEPHGKHYGAEVAAPSFANVGKQVAQIINLLPDIPAPKPIMTAASIRGNP